MDSTDWPNINIWDSDTSMGCGTVDGTYTSYTTSGSPGQVLTVTSPSTGNLTIGTGYVPPNYINTGITGSAYPNVYPNGNVILDNTALLITHNGKTINVGQAITMLMDRLCFIEPSFHLHEKYPALKEAYDAYKAIEAMCKAGDKEEDD